jgi:hypothetical protein
VSQGILAWTQRRSESEPDAPFDIATTLIGSGGTGISAGQSARLIVQGVLEANERLTDSGRCPVSRVYIIELYLDRATEAWGALRVQLEANPGRFSVSETIEIGVGGLRRPLDAGYRGTRYDLISAVTTPGDHGDVAIAYTLDTRRARTEVRAQKAQRELLRALVTSGSNNLDEDAFLGGTLFRLLVPVELEPFLAGTTEALIELDSGTAGIPWELLDSVPGGRTDGDTRPWAIRAKLIRRLRTSEFRRDVSAADSDGSVLVIGEPACDPQLYPRLPAANAEAKAIVETLESLAGLRGGRVKGLVSPN